MTRGEVLSCFLLVPAGVAVCAWAFSPPWPSPEPLRSPTCPEYRGAVVTLAVTHLGEKYVKCQYAPAVAAPKAAK